MGTPRTSDRETGVAASLGKDYSRLRAFLIRHTFAGVIFRPASRTWKSWRIVYIRPGAESREVSMGEVLFSVENPNPKNKITVNIVW